MALLESAWRNNLSEIDERSNCLFDFSAVFATSSSTLLTIKSNFACTLSPSFSSSSYVPVWEASKYNVISSPVPIIVSSFFSLLYSTSFPVFFSSKLKDFGKDNLYYLSFTAPFIHIILLLVDFFSNLIASCLCSSVLA